MKGVKVKDELSESAHNELGDLELFLKKILYHRGIRTHKEAQEFLNVSYKEHTHDPNLIPDIGKAADRVLRAVRDNEKIAIYADYDADGIPGAVVINDFFEKIKFENFEVYIPHRNSEGFGLNENAIKTLSEEGVDLIITVDCGSSDFDQVELAKELGMDVIVTDHHTPSDPEPNAHSLVNPKRKKSKYPFKELAGAAVAFKLVQVLLSKLRSTNYDLSSISPEWDKWLLDMVGIATLSDMVPLVGENRVFAKYGLVVLRKSRRPGLRSLLRKLKIRQDVMSEDDIGFMISPRINAASRMDEPKDAFKMLSAKSAEEGDVYAKHLDHINNERKGLVASMVKEARHRIEKIGKVRDVLIVGDPRWRPGLVGLAAQKLAESYGRPAFVWGREGGDVIRGSVRSDGSINVVEIMKHSEEIFLEYGGHDFSGGFSVSHEKIHKLDEALNNSYKNIEVTRMEGNGEIEVDDRLSVDDINEITWQKIDQLSPFGEGNPKPIFLFENVEAIAISAFGKDKNHTKLMIENNDGKKIEAIAFFKTPDEFSTTPDEGGVYNLVATLEKSYFMNRPQLRLRIIDIIRNNSQE